MALTVDIEKRLGSFTLRVSFEARNGVTALLGASGSGKSLTCRCVAGIEKPDCGRIVLDGRVLFDSEKHICLPPQQRRTGYLFQHYALFPNMTVQQNLSCAVRQRENKDQIVQEMLRRVQMEGFEKHYPRQLSGGQQQRVALARILVNAPDMLMLDEPFSALDSHLRFRLQRETNRIIHDFGRTVLLVSHNRDEVFQLADDIAIVRDGRIETIGEKHAIFSAPGTVEGARLTGCKNISRLRRLDEHHAVAEDWGITLKTPLLDDSITHAGIRMHDVKPGGGDNSTLCRVTEETETPFTYVVMLVPESASAGALPIGMELPKDVWNAVKSERLTVGLPDQSMLWLKS